MVATLINYTPQRLVCCFCMLANDHSNISANIRAEQRHVQHAYTVLSFCQIVCADEPTMDQMSPKMGNVKSMIERPASWFASASLLRVGCHLLLSTVAAFLAYPISCPLHLLEYLALSFGNIYTTRLCTASGSAVSDSLMHRRGISCVAEISSTAGTRRCASTSSNPRPPFRLPKKTYDRIESTTKLLAVAAAKGEARRSKYKKPYSGETSHTVDSKKPYQQSTILPSSERVAFYAEPEEQGDLLSDLSQLDVQKRERLPTGAFVELRRCVRSPAMRPLSLDYYL